MSPRRYASRSRCTDRCVSFISTNATLSSIAINAASVVAGDGGRTDGTLGRGRGIRALDRADAVHLVAPHGLGAALHLDGAEIHRDHVGPELGQRLGADRDLIAARDVARREAGR